MRRPTNNPKAQDIDVEAVETLLHAVEQLGFDGARELIKLAQEDVLSTPEQVLTRLDPFIQRRAAELKGGAR